MYLMLDKSCATNDANTRSESQLKTSRELITKKIRRAKAFLSILPAAKTS